MWIEIFRACWNKVQLCESLSARRVWIEIACMQWNIGLEKSLSARRVWIEIQVDEFGETHTTVTLCEESVD